jgi:hypothetical protein
MQVMCYVYAGLPLERAGQRDFGGRELQKIIW